MSKTDRLPFSGQEFEYRGMTGHEEDILTDEKKVKKGDALDEVLKNCVLSIEGEKPSISTIRSLKSPDRLYILLMVRKESYGSFMENVEVTCPNPRCRQTNLVDIDLDELEYVENKMEGDTVEVEIDGKKVIFGHLDGNDEKKLANRKDTKDILTIGMQMRIQEVEGVHPNGIKKWLKDLPVKERMKLRTEMEKTECGINTVIEFPCDECGKTISQRVEGLPDFLFPQM